MSAIIDGRRPELVGIDTMDGDEWVTVCFARTPLVALFKAWIGLKLRTFRIREGIDVIATVVDGELVEEQL